MSDKKQMGCYYASGITPAEAARQAEAESSFADWLGFPPVLYSTPMAQERVQWRFPRSKKKRIRAKWVKRECNVRYEPRIYRSGNAYYCHPTLYERLRSEILEAPRASTLWHNAAMSDCAGGKLKS